MASYSESFNQADSTTLGPDLTWTELANDWQTVSNRATPRSNNGGAAARAEHDLATTDHAVEAVVRFDTSVSGVIGVAARFDSASQTYYRAALDSAGRLDITRIVNGSGTDIASQSRSISANTDYTIRLECDGSTIRARVDADTWLTVTDTGITTGTRFGLAGYRTNRDLLVDSITAADLLSAVGNEVQLLWDVQAVVAKTLQTIHNVNTIVAREVSLLHDIRANVGLDRQILWNVTGRVAKTLDLLHDVNALTGRNLQTVHNVLVSVGVPLQVLHNIRANVAASNQAVYNVNALVGASRQLTWNDLAKVGTELSIAHAINSIVGQQLQTIWLVAATVSQQLDARWAVQSSGGGVVTSQDPVGALNDMLIARGKEPAGDLAGALARLASGSGYGPVKSLDILGAESDAVVGAINELAKTADLDLAEAIRKWAESGNF